jgi:uncharacterized protein
MIGLKTFLLLILSNIFMTVAWYGHLRFKHKPLWIVILASCLIAFAEYCFQVPANRMGHGFFTAPQLKVIQEGITFCVFAIFSVIYLREKSTIYDFIAYGLVFLAVTVSVFQPKL